MSDKIKKWLTKSQNDPVTVAHGKISNMAGEISRISDEITKMAESL
jgi:hypothetical protein